MTNGPAEDWRARGRLFNTAAGDYLDGRPGYPAEVFDTLRTRCGLRAGCAVLEVGAGAGQATLALLEAGARVTAIEPGDNLAGALAGRAGSGALTTMVSTFEDADLTRRQFDLVVSATAFHWVQPHVGFPKAAKLLREGGWLALWWTIWGDPDRPDPLATCLAPVLERKAPHLLVESAGPAQYVLDSNSRRAEFDLTDLLGEPEQEIIAWTGSHDAAQTRALFSTFSPWLALDDALRNELLDDIERLVVDEFDGVVERPYLTVMYSAQRVS